MYDAEEVSRSDYLSVAPPKLEFTFDYGNFKAQGGTVHVANYFSRSCPIQLLSMETRYFRIRNVIQVNENSSLSPFLNLRDVCMYFTTDRKK